MQDNHIYVLSPNRARWLGSYYTPVLGEATAGINGNVTSFQLLGGIDNGGLSGMFTGMVVNQHDGSKFIGVGIQPDIPAPLTIEGIRQQKDVQLEAAVNYLNQRLALP